MVAFSHSNFFLKYPDRGERANKIGKGWYKCMSGHLPLRMRKLGMDELGRKSVNEFRGSEKTPVVVVLDNIRSMHNVGSVFRTADAFLLEGICLCGYTPQPPHRDIHKTALGATETVDWQYFATTVEAVRALQVEGFAVFAVEQTEGSVPLQEFAAAQHSGKLAVVFGNEVSGVGEEALALCNGSVEIPQWGMKHSLNISIAAGIVLWELVREKFKKL
jgi:23S rRNA (guanosine2251-2'-O)-methyltransferase